MLGALSLGYFKPAGGVPVPPAPGEPASAGAGTG